MTQKRLGGHDYKRLPEWESNLPPEDVKVVCRVGAVGDDHVYVDQLLDGEPLILGWEVLWIITRNIKI